jgi:hypothetical protein
VLIDGNLGVVVFTFFSYLSFRDAGADRRVAEEVAAAEGMPDPSQRADLAGAGPSEPRPQPTRGASAT